MPNNYSHINNLLTELSESIVLETGKVPGSSNNSSAEDIRGELQEGWDLAEYYKSDLSFDADLAFANHSEMFEDNPANVFTPDTKVKPRTPIFQNTNFRIGAVAASIALITGLWFLLPDEFTTLVNDSDHVKSFVMQDGSMMTLFPGSTLSISSEFSKTNRDVTLEEGQVYVDVTSAKTPFVMDVEGSKLAVSGSAFSAIAGKDDVVVNSFEGAIEYSSKDEVLTIEQGSKFVHDLSTNTFTKTSGADNSIVDFTKGRISFINTPLDEVFERLGSFYNVEFDFNKEDVWNKNFTSAVLDNQSLQSILETIEISFNLDAEHIDKSQYKVTFK